MNFDRIIAVRNNKTVYRDGDKCLKVFYPGYSKSDVFREVLNYVRAEETGLNIPKILEVATFDDKWTIISEHIKGSSLAKLSEKEPDKSEFYLNLLVDLQMSVHEKDCGALDRLSDIFTGRISRCNLAPTVRYDLINRLNSITETTKLCHGDFNPSNVIMSEDGVVYILDWEDATQGEPAADAALTYLTWLTGGEGETAEKFLELYCQKSGKSLDFVRKWIPIAAASKIVVSNAKEREILYSVIS